MRTLLILAISLFFCSRTSAQVAAPAAADSAAPRDFFHPSPKKTALFSAIIPGSGQAFNRQYWKIPVIYGGLGGLLYYYSFNRSEYQRFRVAYIKRLVDPSDRTEAIYTTGNLKQLQDEYKKDVDVSVLLCVVGYSLQVVDALVFAHLKNFDMTKDISLNIEPMVTPNGLAGGLTLRYHF